MTVAEDHACPKLLTEPLVCTVTMRASSTAAYDVTFDPGCARAFRGHLRRWMASWTWRTDPTQKTTPYEISVRLLPTVHSTGR